MEETKYCSQCAKTALYCVAGVATFLLMGFLVKEMVAITQPAPVGVDRAAARAKDNAEIRGAGAEAAKSYGYVNEPATAKAQGFVRVPIADSMKRTVEEYSDPMKFHTNLVARSEKANTVPKYD